MILTDRVWKLLEPATAIADNLTKEEIEKGLTDGTYQIFMDEKSVVITADYIDTLRIGLAGGELNSLKNLEKKIIKYAKEKKYKCVDILGRMGWEKSLKGYKKQAVLLRKEIA